MSSHRLALAITVDVEEDMPHWVPEREVSVRNVAGLPALQRLADEFGVPPTYLTAYRVAACPEGARILSAIHAAGRCEVGAHLHPWNTPPLPNDPEREAQRPSQIPRGTLASKMTALTDTLERTFGVRPRSYRAGRFGLDGTGLAELERLGYAVDSSVTPGVSWAQEGGEDFTHAPAAPYFPDRTHPGQPGTSSIYEVPVSIGLTRRLPPLLRRAFFHAPRWTRFRGLLSRDGLRVVDQVWLYPTLFGEADLLRVAGVLVDEGAPVLNVFLHSSEIFPGTSPYAKTPADVELILTRLRHLVAHAVHRLGARGATLTQLRPPQTGASNPAEAP